MKSFDNTKFILPRHKYNAVMRKLGSLGYHQLQQYNGNGDIYLFIYDKSSWGVKFSFTDELHHYRNHDHKEITVSDILGTGVKLYEIY